MGSVRVANVQVIASTGAALSASASPTDSSSASPSPSASSSASSAQAYLTLTVSSTQDDELTGASVGGGGTVTPTASTSSLVVKPGQLLIIGDPQTSSGSSGPALAISGLSSAPVVGTTVPVTLNFKNAGSVTVQAPVRDSQPA